MADENQPIAISNRVKAAIFIVIALILAGFSIEESLTEEERVAMEQAMPSVSDMATSPIAQKMLSQEAGQNEENQQTGEEGGERQDNNKGDDESGGIEGNDEEIVNEPIQDQSNVLDMVSTGVLDNYSQAIVINKIGAVLPIVNPNTYNINDLHTDLDSGVVLYPGSVLFGQKGQTVILGHSAPDNWPNIKHDTAFSRIDELTPGDLIIVYFNDEVFNYRVTRTEIINKGGDLSGIPPEGNSLVLVTCWPPGKDLKRIVVESIWDKTE